MNATAIRDIRSGRRFRSVCDAAAEFAAAADVLHTATQAWLSLTPTRYGADAISNHLEGMRRVLTDLKLALNNERSGVAATTPQPQVAAY